MTNIKLLQFYLDAGIDEIMSETPINRLKTKITNNTQIIAKNQQLPASQNSSGNMVNFNNQFGTFGAIAKLAQKQMNNNQIANQSNPPLISMAEIITQARQMAENSNNLSDLEKAVKDFDGCSLKKMATNTVFCDGDSKSPIMIIGEAPGNNEDLQGIPFCGESGKLLNEMFKAIGFVREKLYITNTLFWRPPGNRRPTEDELAMCKPFVEKHIAFVKPKLIVLMGATAMSNVLKINNPISKMRGKFFEYDNQYLSDPIKTTILFHPSYLLRQSSKKREAWRDLLMIKDFIKHNNIK